MVGFRILAAFTLALGLAAAHAEDDKRSAQLREAARRAQAAAQQAQQELGNVKAERDKLASEQAARQQAAEAAQKQQRAQAGQLAQSRQALAQSESERDQLRDALARETVAREQLQQQLDALQAEKFAAARSLDEQRRVTQAVTALLERSVKALAAAEDANRRLHSLGLAAVKAYTEATPEAMRAQSEPFLRLGAVDLENEAESLRRELDAQRMVP
jgi:chromosome segregation ATPase